MGEIHDHTDPIQLLNRRNAELTKAAVHTLSTPIPNVIAAIVGQLDDPDVKAVKDSNESQVILDGFGILETENYTHLAIPLRLQQIPRSLHNHNTLSDACQASLPPNVTGDRLSEVLFGK
jgi:hypothetical protein